MRSLLYLLRAVVPIVAGIFAGLSLALPLASSSDGLDHILDLVFTDVDYGDQLARFNEQIRLDPSDPSGYYDRGKTYIALINYSGAVDDFSRVIEIAPHYPWAYFRRGEVRARQEQWDAAVADFTDAIAHGFPEPSIYLDRASAYEHLGLWANAATDLDIYLRLLPNAPDSADVQRRLDRARREQEQQTRSQHE